MMYTVNNVDYRDLKDAIDSAVKISSGKNRSQIMVFFDKGGSGQGYPALNRVVAYFYDGRDLNALAADEDGNPDMAVRATALTK